MDFTHTSEPTQSGTFHYWETRGPHGAVSLSLLHSRDAAFDPGLLAPSAARLVESTDGGHWVFDVLQVHVPNGPESGWSCIRHGDPCDVDALGGHIADPLWDRLRAAGVTDQAVRAELEPLLGVVFGEVTA